MRRRNLPRTILPTMTLSLSLLIMICIGLNPAGFSMTIPNPAFESNLPTQIDAAVERLMTQNLIPGLQVGIVRNNSVFYTQGYGKTSDSSVSMTATTPMMIASVSKSFTALAILQLNESGVLALDRRIIDYLPEFQTASPAWTSLMTVQDCLYQTTGFSTIAGNDPKLDRLSLPATIQALADVPLVHQPGTTFEYSNLNYRVLGYLIEILTEEPFENYITSHIFSPLGMNSTYPTQTLAEPQGLLPGYRNWFGFSIPWDHDYGPAISPSGGIVSTATDICNYMLFQLGSTSVSNSSVLSGSYLHRGHSLPVYLPSSIYAMGWYNVTTPDGYDLLVHGGDLSTFHTDVVLLPEYKLGVVVMMNINSYTGNLAGYNSIYQTLIALMLEDPLPSFPLTHRLVYLILDCLIFLSLGVSGWRLYTSTSRFRTFIQKLDRKSFTRPQQIRRSLLRLLLQLVCPLIIVGVIPLGVGQLLGISNLTYAVIATVQPDLVFWMVLLGILSEVQAGIAIFSFKSRFFARNNSFFVDGAHS